jgi:hypothetical protein
MKLRSGQNSHINCVCANNRIYPLYESRRFGKKILQLQKMKVSCCVPKGEEMWMGMAYLQRGIEEVLCSQSSVSTEQDLRPSSTQRDPLVLGELKQQLEEGVRVAGIGEGLPTLVQHAAIRVSDLDTLVTYGVVRGGDDESGGGPAKLGGAERSEDGGAADGERHNGSGVWSPLHTR